MKVLHFCHSFWPYYGGTGEIVGNLVLSLRKKGIEGEVVCFRKSIDGKVYESGKIKGIKVKRLNLFNLHKVYPIAPGAVKEFFRKDIDIIHIHTTGFLADAALLLKPFHRKKVVVSTHGGIFHTKEPIILKKIYWTFSSLTFKFCDKVVAVSKNDFDIFKKKTNKIVTIENPISLEFKKIPKKKKNTFMCMGRISRNKRVPLLGEVFDLVGKKVFVAGNAEGENKKELEKHKSLDLLGFVGNPKRMSLYKNSEYYVSAASFEGFGLGLVEAMMASCIPIVQPNNAFKTLLTKKEGFFVDYSKTKKAADEIKKIISMSEKKKNELRKECFNKAKTFLWKNKVNDFIKVYDEVLK
ncbi:MAG: glycosyltransferase family 4 protein [Candidatus Diapherotrites archaeon]|jgi:alpha-1,3-mannosyltransferase|uniref:Glycosyltransferase family 4 protein n=1 Tax=Candidatus Iainarchaeum sp. TaxID=3101447 RepID=A0A8T5GGX5_9ARCH|nr:glycosyltransferase family 4 protein [Candidatus Diapherotrites archaeon]